MTFTIKTNFYDYFGGQKVTYKSFENLLEGWNTFKKELATDFRYDDAFQETTYFVTHNYTVVDKPQRPHARSLYAWEKMCKERKEKEYRDAHNGFNEMEVEFLTSLFVDIPDDIEEDIIF